MGQVLGVRIDMRGGNFSTESRAQEGGEDGGWRVRCGTVGCVSGSDQ